MKIVPVTQPVTPGAIVRVRETGVVTVRVPIAADRLAAMTTVAPTIARVVSGGMLDVIVDPTALRTVETGDPSARIGTKVAVRRSTSSVRGWPLVTTNRKRHQRLMSARFPVRCEPSSRACRRNSRPSWLRTSWPPVN